MEYTRLGTSGLKVSRICLGCMSFGDASQRGWTLDQNAAEPIFRKALELGITFWDTANVYGHGSSEEIVGHAIKKYTRREDIVLATKLNGKMSDGPGGQGLSRRAVMEQVDASLTRLGTDYIDLYQIHRFDPETPVEETMEALHDVIKAGKVRYIGASSMYAWQFATMQHAADLGGWTRFISMQDQYSLIMREEEREMFPLLDLQGVDSIPWSPLAGGRVLHGGELPRVHAGGADVAHLAGLDHVVERFHRLFARRLGVEAVDLVEVDVVGAQPGQRGVDLLHHRAARQALTAGPVGHLPEQLRRQDDVLAAGVLADRVTHDLLARPGGVDIGGVPE